MLINTFEKNTLPKLLKSRIPFVLHSEPGIGKSDTISTAANHGWRVLWYHPVVSDPTDFKGMPFAFMQADQLKARFVPFNDLEVLTTADTPTLACFDDLGQAPMAVQAALMQLFLARRINGHQISDHVLFCAATNRAEDKAGVTGMIEPLKGRGKLYGLETHIDPFCEWYYAQEEMDPLVPAFLRFKTELLSAFEPTRAMTNSPNPRNWARTGHGLYHGLDDFESIAGDVGDGAASEFIAFKEVYQELPDPDGILKNPTQAEVPSDKPSVMYALIGALAHRASVKTAEGLVTYLNRLPGDFSVKCMKDAQARNKKNSKFMNHPAIGQWCLDHAEVVSVNL